MFREYALPNNSAVFMFREYALPNGDYVRTNLIVHGPKGSTEIHDLTPSEIGLLTKAGIEKL